GRDQLERVAIFRRPDLGRDRPDLLVQGQGILLKGVGRQEKDLDLGHHSRSPPELRPKKVTALNFYSEGSSPLSTASPRRSLALPGPWPTRDVGADLWPQLFSDVSCIALWISSEKILTRLYSILHWFHKRLEVNVKNPRENRCFQT